MRAASRSAVVDGIRTHYFDAGDGPALVLLHGGAFGECAETSWDRNIDALATEHRVLAPDWLGFGQTDKLRDFVDPFGRMLAHMRRFLEVLDITEADFAGLSMGGTFLVRVAASERPIFPIRRMVLVSGGGFSPDNEARRAIGQYDGTVEDMRRIVGTVFHQPRWAADEAFVRRRHELSLLPGAYEVFAAARVAAPGHTPRSPAGAPDTTPYEQVAVPTLVTAGRHDPLRLPGYADELADRIPDAKAIVFSDSGHCPNIEESERWNTVALDFLSR